jgi:pimeloyl-ACP methyl ester carboxylesterase
MKTAARAVVAACVTWAALLAGAPAGADAKHDPDMHRHEPRACIDGTPHRERRVAIDRGASLQVLDWGGAGKPRTMVLLTGLGDNAHVYDQFAFQFTDDFHVIGITRRGFLPSSQPASGYDVATRARDDVAVLDALGIDRAVFVGHSVAGSELTALALDHPARVEALVYLDAYDLSRRFALPDIPGAPFTERDGDSLSLYQAASVRYDDTLRPDHAVCIGVGFARNGSIAGSTTPSFIPAGILHGVQEPQSQPVDWSKLTVPRLGIFGLPSVTARLPYYWYLDAAGQAAFDAAWPAIVQWYADRIDDFAVAHAAAPAPVVYTLPGASHYFYLNQQAFVVIAMRQFLLGSIK